MDIIKHNLRFFDSLDNDSAPLNITVIDNKIIINDHSWLRSSSVDAEDLYKVIVWTFDNATINFWENYQMSNWLSERYKTKFSNMYDAFVSLQYVYDKCEQEGYPKEFLDRMKNYDKELDTRLDIIYEFCIETCKPWDYFKIGVRKAIELTNTNEEYECLNIESEEPTGTLLVSSDKKEE